MALCVLVTVLYGLTRGDWLNGLLAGITLAMANLPEEIPVVLTVFLALGAWRISQKGVLTRRAPAIETLGATTVLCVDKTGTLTQNRMVVRRLWVPGKEVDRRHAEAQFCRELIEFSVLASEREPFDPMEKAYHRLARERAPGVIEKLRRGRLPHSTRCPLNNCRSPTSGRRNDSERYIVAAKGAPEAIARTVHARSQQRAAMHEQVAAMAARACAFWPWRERHAITGARAPSSGARVAARSAAALHWAHRTRRSHSGRRAGGIARMLHRGNPHRNDHRRLPWHGQAIARQIGLRDAETVVTGPELAAMTRCTTA